MDTGILNQSNQSENMDITVSCSHNVHGIGNIILVHLGMLDVPNRQGTISLRKAFMRYNSS